MSLQNLQQYVPLVQRQYIVYWKNGARPLKKKFKIEEFKLLLDMPKYYGPSEIDRAIIKPTLQELTPFLKI